MDKNKILVVDDDSLILNFILEKLVSEGFQVIIASNGKDALELCRQFKPNLVLLDVMMPVMDGFKTCTKIREFSSVPIIFLSAKNEPEDRVLGLTCGSDDYITKPFDSNELVLRIKAVLKRTESGHMNIQREILKFSSLVINLASRTVTRNQQEVELTAKEFDLLWFLASNPERVFTREQLIYHIWNSDYYGDNTVVTMLVKRLREKVEEDPSNPTYVKTVRGVGYKFSDVVEI